MDRSKIYTAQPMRTSLMTKNTATEIIVVEAERRRGKPRCEVAAAGIAKKYLRLTFGTEIRGYLAEIGAIRPEVKSLDTVDGNPFFCPDPEMIDPIAELIERLRRDGDSIGARVNVMASNIPVGLGEPVFDKLDADLAAALVSINAVKGVEFGAGFGSDSTTRQ